MCIFHVLLMTSAAWDSTAFLLSTSNVEEECGIWRNLRQSLRKRLIISFLWFVLDDERLVLFVVRTLTANNTNYTSSRDRRLTHHCDQDVINERNEEKSEEEELFRQKQDWEMILCHCKTCVSLSDKWWVQLSFLLFLFLFWRQTERIVFRSPSLTHEMPERDALRVSFGIRKRRQRRSCN